MTNDNLWPGWKTVRQIGAGSFGKVYEIEREENGVLKKSALKVMSIPPAPEDVQYIYDSGLVSTEEDASTYIGSQVQTVVQEIRTMAELRWHPNIVGYQAHRIIPHDGWIGSDILIRMELLTPLNRYIRSHGLTEQDTARLGVDICRALEACQSLNPPVLHRDIKPANIMLDDNGTFKLGDFGVARVMEGTKSAHTRAGTEDYMAPEVLQMKGYFATADIYSLGMVLYRMLNNNRNPFLPLDGIPDNQMQMEARANRLTGKRIPPPNAGSAELKRAVLKALEYEPAKRYQNAMEFRWALEKCPEQAQNAEEWGISQPTSQDQRAVQEPVNISGGTFLGEAQRNTYEPFQGTAYGTVQQNPASTIGGTIIDAGGQNFKASVPLNSSGPVIQQSVGNDNTIGGTVLDSGQWQQAESAQKSNGSTSNSKNTPKKETGSYNYHYKEKRDWSNYQPPQKGYHYKEKRDEYIKQREKQATEERKKQEEIERKKKRTIVIILVALVIFGLAYQAAKAQNPGVNQNTAQTAAVGAEDYIELPDFSADGYGLCNAYTYLKSNGLKPDIQFTKYQEGKSGHILSQSTNRARKGDKVTITVGGWVKDDIQVFPKKISLKVGEKRRYIASFHGNYPEEFWMNARYDKSVIKMEWGDWISSTQCELYLTALEPIGSNQILILTLYPSENSDEDAWAGSVVEISETK